MAVTLEGLAGVDTEAARELSPTEERILVAALGLIGRRGVRRLGMQEIAEAAGVSRGTLYRYFPSKEQVLTAAAAYDERRFSDGVDRLLAAAFERRSNASATSWRTPSTSSARTPPVRSSSPSRASC